MNKLLLYSSMLATLSPLITSTAINFRTMATPPNSVAETHRKLNPTALSDSELSIALSQARKATARYHTVEAAEADGYVDINFCEPQEGCHWLKPALVDANFDPEHPEVLLYAPDENGRMRLVAVEYLVPVDSLTPVAPEGFVGDADEWREESEGPGFWELTVWLWLNNPDGIFEHHNLRLP